MLFTETLNQGEQIKGGLIVQRIVDGYIYDTETATLLYTESGKNVKYYMTAKRRFFVYYSNNEFQVVTEAVMKDFLGKYDIAKYIEIFGEPQEG